MYVGQGAAFAAAVFGASAVALHGARSGARWHLVALRILAVLYGGWVLSVTVLPLGASAPVAARVDQDFLHYSVNLVPFRTILLYLRSDLGRIAAINLLGNMALLVPLGLFGPVLWRRLDRWWKVTFAGMSVSLVIEGLQYVRQFVNVNGVSRSVDIDDVILNTVGALLGFVIFLVARRTWRSIQKGDTAGVPAVERGTREP